MMRRNRRAPRIAPPILASRAALEAALGIATGGETFYITDGNHGVLSLVNKNYATKVSIRAAGTAVNFEQIIINNCSNIRFDSINVLAVSATVNDSLIGVNNSDNIDFFRMEVVGYPGGSSDENPIGFNFTDCEQIVVSHCKQHHLQFGILTVRVDGIEHSYCELNEIRLVGSLRGYTVSNAQVLYNTYSGPVPVGDDHYDFLHLWTTAVQPPSSNVLIEGNLCLERTNPTICVFIESDVGIASHTNFTFRNNIFYTTHPNGIFLENVNGVTIENNTLIGVPSQYSQGNPDVRLTKGTSNVNCEKNVLCRTDQAGDNKLLVYHTPNNSMYAMDLFVDVATAGSKQIKEQLLPLPNKTVPIESDGYGAQVLYTTYAKPLVYIDVIKQYPNEARSQFLTFEAVAYPGGGLPGSGVTYSWDFGEGSPVVGNTVNHTFGTSGFREVTVTVLLDGTPIGTSTRTIDIIHPLLYDMELISDAVNLGHAGGTISWAVPTFQDGGAKFPGDTSNNITITGQNRTVQGMRAVTTAFDVKMPTPVVYLGIFSGTHGSVLATASGGGQLYHQVGSTTGLQQHQATVGAWVYVNSWVRVHCVFDSDAGTQECWVDGTLRASASGRSGLVATATAYTASFGGFNGSIKNARAYRGVVLPSDESTILAELRALA